MLYFDVQSGRAAPPGGPRPGLARTTVPASGRTGRPLIERHGCGTRYRCDPSGPGRRRAGELRMEGLEVHEHIEHAGHGDSHAVGVNRRVALLIAVLAAALAIAEAAGKAAQTEALSAKVEASDLWAFYQAKTIRQTTVRTAAKAARLELGGPDLATEGRGAGQRAGDDWGAAGAGGAGPGTRAPGRGPAPGRRLGADGGAVRERPGQPRGAQGAGRAGQGGGGGARPRGRRLPPLRVRLRLLPARHRPGLGLRHHRRPGA